MAMARQVGAIASANVVYLISQTVVLSLLTYLTPIETVAAFGLVTAVTQPLFHLALLGLRENLATDATEQFSFGTFLSLRLVMTVLMLVVGLAVFALYRPEYIPLALPILVAKATEMMANLSYGAQQRAGVVRYIAASQIMRGPLATVLFAGALVTTRDAALAFWVQSFVLITILVLYDTRRLRDLGIAITADRDWRNWWTLTRNTAPLGVGSFVAILQVNVPRYLTEAMMPPLALALLTVVSYLQQAAQALFQSVDQALSWRLSRAWAEQRHDHFWALLKRMLALAVALGVATIAGAWLFGGFALGLFFGKAYAAGAPLFNWVALAIALRLCANVLQSALTSQRRFVAYGKIQLILFLAAIPTVYAGAKYAGLTGVGMAIAAVGLLRMLLYVAILLRKGRGISDPGHV